VRATRRFISLLAAAIFVAMIATPATAEPPFQVRITDPMTVLLPGEDFCGFDVQAEVEQKFKFIAFSGNRGTLWTAITVGKIKVVLTNLETGETLPVNIPGPGFIDADGNTIVGTGPWLVFVPGQLLFLVGHITFEPGPFGVQPTVVRGRSLDLCAALAPA
jgi:hypothetical protein